MEALKANPKDATLPEGCTFDSYYRSESRPLHELKPHWRDLGQEVSFIHWLNLRDRARKDLFWLGKRVLRKDLTTWHKEPCERLFVQKQFDGVYSLGYTIGTVHEAIGKQTRKKEMLFLASRGSFKSTLDGIDCVQWLLNCPDIRILILTGEYKLALAFMSEIKGYFYMAPKAQPSLLHKLFPEYILEEINDQPLKCPARIHNQKEPSLWVNAIVANLSGWHCFAAGTLITCRRGLVPIEQVTTDDSVLTRKGWKNVLRSGVTGVERTINFLGLRVTPGHKIFTQEDGFSSIMDVICHATRNLLIHKKSFSEALSLGAIQAQEHILTAPTIADFGKEEKKRYIEQFGNPCTDQSLTEKTCTTKTTTQATTRSMEATTNSEIESSIGVITESYKENTSPSISTLRASDVDWISCAEIENDSVAHLAIWCTGELPLSPATIVYDLQVEDCHEFFANGILVHNCDVRKMDDVVTDENSNGVDSRGKDGKLKLKIDGTDNLVDEWGFTDMIGTPYYVDDYYAERMKADAIEAPLEFGRFPCWTIKAPWIGTPLKELSADMVDLLFPEKLTFKSLRQKLVKNERLFRCQQLCEPAADSESPVTFTEEELKKHLVASAPAEGDCFITWDTSFARTSYADFSAGVCGRIVQYDDRYELYIMEIIFGRWRPSELAFQMVQFEKKWKPRATMVERPAGAELLQMEIQRQAQRYQVALNIIWKTASSEPNAKRNRIKGFQTLLSNDIVYFVGGQWIDETFDQLIKYTGESKNRGRKDDIPDGLAYQQFFCPSTENNKELEKAKQEREQRAEQKAIYSNIFETPVYQAPQVQPVSMRQRLFGSLAR